MSRHGLEMIRVLRPRLPESTQIAPYLRRIDAAQVYSNFGPLLLEFEARLAALFGVGPRDISCVSNGTLALSLALKAQSPPRGSLCLMPSWTFAATAHAVLVNELIPYFVDVRPETWAIDPDLARDALRAAPGRIGAIVPVVPFGCPFDYAAWDRFAAETGIAIAIDAAAGFDTAEPGQVPLALSMHATKCFGIGEGGVVLSRDAALVKRVRQLSCFGFEPGTRDALFAAINAKLSEYAAAVALATLDAWPYTRIGLASLARAYAASLAALPGVAPMPGLDGSFAGSTFNVVIGPAYAGAVEVAARLAERGIETRRWWGEGCHVQPAFADCPRGTLDVTDDLARHSLGLPFHLGLGPREIRIVIDTLAHALVSAAPQSRYGAAG